jgi:hypothetical protein
MHIDAIKIPIKAKKFKHGVKGLLGIFTIFIFVIIKSVQ